MPRNQIVDEGYTKVLVSEETIGINFLKHEASIKSENEKEK